MTDGRPSAEDIVTAAGITPPPTIDVAAPQGINNLIQALDNGVLPDTYVRNGTLVQLVHVTATTNNSNQRAPLAVVDVGGGSTGVGVFRDGVLTRLDDRPGGGHHLDLVLAGALGIPVEEAEPYKRTHPRESLPILVPGLQKIAENVRDLTRGDEDLPLHLAGGALMVPGADDVLASYLERTVVTYPHALLITPLGIARCAP